MDSQWKTNVNFIPIPKDSNKYWKIKKAKRKVDWEGYFKHLDSINED